MDTGIAAIQDLHHDVQSQADGQRYQYDKALMNCVHQGFGSKQIDLDRVASRQS